MAAGETATTLLIYKGICIEACGIRPLDTKNVLDGRFIKKKSADRKHYDFYMEMGGARLRPSEEMCHKLFACKGTRIFQTPLTFEFDATAVTVTKGSDGDAIPALRGTVREVVDYGEIQYARIALGDSEATVIAVYNGRVGDEVSLTADDTRITVKDRTIDMIIV